jgi:hypothetical protein
LPPQKAAILLTAQDFPSFGLNRLTGLVFMTLTFNFGKNCFKRTVIFPRTAQLIKQFQFFFEQQRFCFDIYNNRQAVPPEYRQYAVIYTDFWEPYTGVLPSKRRRPVAKNSGKTGHIERFNNTVRQRISRFVRKTPSFSKKLENHIGAMLHIIQITFQFCGIDLPSFYQFAAEICLHLSVINFIPADSVMSERGDSRVQRRIICPVRTGIVKPPVETDLRCGKIFYCLG